MKEHPHELRFWGNIGLLLGAGGLAFTCLGFFLAPDLFFRGWLWAWLFVLGLSLGSAAVVMIHHLSGGAWGLVIRRTLEAALAPMPWLVLLFVPVFFGLWRLYPWSDPALVAHEPVLAYRSAYMNAPWFIVRSIVYLGVWTALTLRLRRLSADHIAGEAAAEPEYSAGPRLRLLSPPALILYVVLATFAMYDWVISLDPRWFSSMFGALMCMGQLLSAYALALVLLPWVAPYAAQGTAQPLQINERVLNQLGNLLLAFISLWTYMAFGQFLIIWAGNLPSEVGWYLRRIEGPWAWVIGLVVLFEFVVPFAVLLSRAAKRRVAVLQTVAALIFLTQMLYQFWVVMPSGPERGWSVLTATAAMLGLGGIWFWLFARALSAGPTEPGCDHA